MFGFSIHNVELQPNPKNTSFKIFPYRKTSTNFINHDTRNVIAGELSEVKNSRISNAITDKEFQIIISKEKMLLAKLHLTLEGKINTFSALASQDFLNTADKLLLNKRPIDNKNTSSHDDINNKLEFLMSSGNYNKDKLAIETSGLDASFNNPNILDVSNLQKMIDGYKLANEDFAKSAILNKEEMTTLNRELNTLKESYEYISHEYQKFQQNAHFQQQYLIRQYEQSSYVYEAKLSDLNKSSINESERLHNIINQQKSELHDIANDISTLRKEKHSRENDIEISYKTQIHDLQSELKISNDRNSDLERSNSNRTHEAEIEKSRLIHELSSLKQTLVNTNAEYQTLQQNAYSQQQSLMQKYQLQAHTYDNNISNLNTTIENLTKNISLIQQSYQTAVNDHKNKEDQITQENQHKIEKLHKDNSDAKCEINILNFDILSLKAENRFLVDRHSQECEAYDVKLSATNVELNELRIKLSKVIKSHEEEKLLLNDQILLLQQSMLENVDNEFQQLHENITNQSQRNSSSLLEFDSAIESIKEDLSSARKSIHQLVDSNPNPAVLSHKSLLIPLNLTDLKDFDNSLIHQMDGTMQPADLTTSQDERLPSHNYNIDIDETQLTIDSIRDNNNYNNRNTLENTDTQSLVVELQADSLILQQSQGEMSSQLQQWMSLSKQHEDEVSILQSTNEILTLQLSQLTLDLTQEQKSSQEYTSTIVTLKHELKLANISLNENTDLVISLKNEIATQLETIHSDSSIIENLQIDLKDANAKVKETESLLQNIQNEIELEASGIAGVKDQCEIKIKRLELLLSVRTEELHNTFLEIEKLQGNSFVLSNRISELQRLLAIAQKNNEVNTGSKDKSKGKGSGKAPYVEEIVPSEDDIRHKEDNEIAPPVSQSKWSSLSNRTSWMTGRMFTKKVNTSTPS